MSYFLTPAGYRISIGTKEARKPASQEGKQDAVSVNSSI